MGVRYSFYTPPTLRIPNPNNAPRLCQIPHLPPGIPAMGVFIMWPRHWLTLSRFMTCHYGQGFSILEMLAGITQKDKETLQSFKNFVGRG